MAFEGIAQLLQSGRPWIGGLEFDCSIHEDHAVEVRLTEQPIEALPGELGQVTDHALVMPRSLTMVVLISNTPDNLIPVVRPFRHLRIWRQLRTLALLRQPVDVVTSLEIYPGMMITRVAAPRRRETTNCLEITCALRQVQFSVSTGAQALADAAAELAESGAELGIQQATARAVSDLTSALAA